MHKEIVRRPIAIGMIFLSLTILGIVAFLKLPIAMLPKVHIPQITVRVNQPNVSASVIEQQATSPLRSSLMQLPHLKEIHSDSRDGSAVLSLRFYYGTDIDRAFIATHEKIDRTLSSLPKEMERPQVMKASVTDLPTCYIQITSKKGEDNQTFLNLSKFTQAVVLRRLEQIPEVAMIDHTGMITSQITIRPNHKALTAHHITIEALEQFMRQSQIRCNDLRVVDGAYEFYINYNGSIQTPEDLNQLMFTQGGRSIPLTRLVNIKEEMKPHQGEVIEGHRSAISLAVIQKSEARFEDLKTALNEVIVDLQKGYPELSFTITRDQTTLLAFAIDNLKQSLFIGALLAILIMFFFMKDYRVSLLMTLTIPVSLIICFMGFYFLGITMNLISISGLILGVGMMIDNAIIVMDNITQHRERGTSLDHACIEGASEVFKPMLSSALTTCAVFIPLIFLSGISGALFYDQAMAITIGLGVSLLVSVTFLPMAYRITFIRKQQVDFTENRWVKHLIHLYEKGMVYCLRHSRRMTALSFLMMVAALWMARTLPKQVMPTISQNEIGVKISWNRPITLKENRLRVHALLDNLTPKPTMSVGYLGTQDFVMFQGDQTEVGDAMIYLSAENSDQLREIEAHIQQKIFKQHPEANITFSASENFLTLFMGKQKAPLQAQFLLDDMAQVAPLQKLWEKLRQSNAIDSIPDLSMKEIYQIEIETPKMNAWQISPEAVAKVLKRSLGQETILHLTDGVTRLPIVVKSPVQHASNFLTQIEVPNANGDKVALSQFAKLVPTKRLKHIEGGTIGTYYPLDIYDVANSKEADKRILSLHKIVDEVDQVELVYGGDIWEREAMVKELMGVFIVSLLLLYLIMSIQFESFLLPFIVLLEVPIDLFGVMLMLKLFGQSINLMSLIGMVVMSGIIINDSILKIDTIQQLMIQQKMSLYKALLVGGQRRFKSIVMTSLTTILAMTPFLFGDGIGNDLQIPLALAVIGGMTLGTLVSLFIVPLLFVGMTKLQRTTLTFTSKGHSTQK
ncbi:efflux RND transporter permease subunit [Halosquirtibacter xylanolyticus]|uniref:efflux RND transporter permease subunit n=1 Tax=Halosquirtibacter xylanolyticus TaxID=3374599 RepID=UPI0037480FAC|nr:efflux RND transporter permease subunit [Prolixibacteraceae bacterium]